MLSPKIIKTKKQQQNDKKKDPIKLALSSLFCFCLLRRSFLHFSPHKKKHTHSHKYTYAVYVYGIHLSRMRSIFCSFLTGSSIPQTGSGNGNGI